MIESFLLLLNLASPYILVVDRQTPKSTIACAVDPVCYDILDLSDPMNNQTPADMALKKWSEPNE